MHTHTHTG